jgi:hypothetical protein
MINSGNLDDSGSGGGFKMVAIPEANEKKNANKKVKLNPLDNFGTEVEREQ